MTVKLMTLSGKYRQFPDEGMWNTYNRWPDMKVITRRGTKNYFLSGNHPICLADPRLACKGQSKQSGSFRTHSKQLADEV